eukprot:TRINITY_DN2729_c0_g5_i2.p1 TRINITY_DN2729_c0_g5~~TRINITY_DN2729_c0_g5_i2.p1  ORF type:complete len:178 (+),score=59.99 TRINITY_DN2729_c0_g5_i2:175-708(+)
MEFVEGTLIDRFSDARVPQELRDRIGELLLRLALKEIFLFRFIQADPNPANFFYDTARSRLALIDLGAGHKFCREFIDGYAKLVYAAANADKHMIMEYLKRTEVLTGEESKKVLDAYLSLSLALGEAFNVGRDSCYDFSTQEATEKVRVSSPVDLQTHASHDRKPTHSLAACDGAAE